MNILIFIFVATSIVYLPTMKRKTSQYLIPITKENHDDSSYDIYPSFPVENGAIKKGYNTLAEELSQLRNSDFRWICGCRLG